MTMQTVTKGTAFARWALGALSGASALAALLAPGPAQAVPAAVATDWPFLNPFASAAQTLAQRGDTPEATLILTYAVTAPDRPGESDTVELVLASDWVLIDRHDETAPLLYDYELGRLYRIHAAEGTFTSHNAIGFLTLRIGEMQRRLAEATSIPLCDSQAELVVWIEGLGPPVAVASTREGDSLTVSCEGAPIGRAQFMPSPVGVAESVLKAPPPSLWPALAESLPMHPGFLRALREAGAVPARLETLAVGDDAPMAVWTLTGAAPAQRPYPLTAALRNGTADFMNGLTQSELGTLGEEAVAGRVNGSAPTVKSWDVQIRVARALGGISAAFMDTVAGLSMFPQTVAQCRSNPGHAACLVVRDLGSAELDPAAAALLLILESEPDGRAAGIVAAMEAAQASPLADHPALAASYALAVRNLPEIAPAARSAGLPTSVIDLEYTAVSGAPYAPAYWTDLGTSFATQRLPQPAFFAYEVGYWLPVPGARLYDNLLNIKAFGAQLRDVMPDFFLPAAGAAGGPR